jgi:hypothetical protein
MSVISGGLSGDESVVVDGQLLLSDGSRVEPRARKAGAKPMTLSELCIRRPVMTTLITASIIAFGIFGFRLLPVSALPRVDFPTMP